MAKYYYDRLKTMILPRNADVNMIIGNGYTHNHAEITLQELRESQALREIFENNYI